MKRATLILSFLILAFVLGVLAGNNVLLGSPTTFNGTTNTASITIGSSILPRGTWLINYSTLATTNQLTGYVQLSTDNTNWLNIGTYYPSGTVSNTDTFVPSYTNQPIYYRMQLVATNSTSVIVQLVN